MEQMLHCGLVAYGVAFTAFAVWDVVKYDPEERVCWRVVDVAVYALTLTGMVLLLMGVQSDALRVIWRPVALLLVTGRAVVVLRSRRRTLADERQTEGLSEGAKRVLTVVTDVATAGIFGPGLAANLFLAFGSLL